VIASVISASSTACASCGPRTASNSQRVGLGPAAASRSGAGWDVVNAFHSQDGVPIDSPAPGHLSSVGDVIRVWGPGQDSVGHTGVVPAVNAPGGNGTITIYDESGALSGVEPGLRDDQCEQLANGRSVEPAISLHPVQLDGSGQRQTCVHRGHAARCHGWDGVRVRLVLAATSADVLAGEWYAASGLRLSAGGLLSRRS
jgi:hypothetical protein